ncbi:MAG: hypothetical protein V1865_02205 [bacterium]
MNFIACLKKATALFVIAVGLFVFTSTAQAAGGNHLELYKPSNNATVSSTTLFAAKDDVDAYFWVNLYYKKDGKFVQMAECIKMWTDYHYCYVDTFKYPDGNYTLQVKSSEGGYYSSEMYYRFSNGQGVLEITGAERRTINGTVNITGREYDKSFTTADLRFYQNKRLRYTFVCNKSGSSWTCPVYSNNMMDGTYDVELMSSVVSSRPVVMTVKNGKDGCKSKTCASLGYNCGEIDDGCGNTINCGNCYNSWICKNNKCQADNRSITWIYPNSAGATSWISGTVDFRIYTRNMSASDKVSLGVIDISKYTGNKSARTIVSECKATNSSYTNYTCTYNTKELPNGESTFYILLDNVAIGSSMVVARISNSSCVPKTCAGEGFSCGIISDGCGDTLNCGSCGTGYLCISGKCTKQAQEVSFIYPNTAGATSWLSGTVNVSISAKNLNINSIVSLGSTYKALSGMTSSKTIVEYCTATNSSYTNYNCTYDTKGLDNGEHEFYVILDYTPVASSKTKVMISNAACNRLTSCLDSQGIICGKFLDDGCGSTIDCRTCPTGYNCDSGYCRQQTSTTVNRNLRITYPGGYYKNVSGTVTFRIESTGFTSADSVNLYRSFNRWGLEFTSVARENCDFSNSVYSCMVDTTKYGNGDYNFYVRTSDGNIVSEKVLINVQN